MNIEEGCETLKQAAKKVAAGPEFEVCKVGEPNMERSGFFVSTFIMREEYAGVSQDGGNTWHPLPLRNDIGTIEPKLTHIRFLKG